MVGFLTLFLGLFFGVREVAVQAAPGVARVELRLDEQPVASLVAPDWKALVDFGSVPLPRTLEAVAFDAEGRIVGRAEQRLNRVRPRSAASLFVTREAEGDFARLVWQSITGKAPERVILLLDGRPVSNENLERIPLPKGRTAVLRAEVRFPDGSSATAETLVGAPAQDAAQAELTALVVARTKKSAAEDPAQMAGFFRSGGKDVPVVAVEDGPADVRVVLSRLAFKALGNPFFTRSLRPTVRRPFEEQIVGAGRFGDGVTWSVVDPEGHTRGEGFRSFLVHRSHSGKEPVLKGLNGLRVVPGEGPQELRMAVALSILDLAEGIGRRAVVVLVASGEEDKGALSVEVVESLSTS
ncbi:MAG: hypothetical protein JNK60_11330, partial [Acidobacteria bacterium]|nr:hypothetical protein [Acidobacteriota bacterium]